MATFRTARNDNRQLKVKIQGAFGQSTSNDFASIVFQNYDYDTATTYDMAELAVRDAFGTSNLNGYGNMVFRTRDGSNTFLQEHMRLTYNGLVGIGTDQPAARLHVSGGSAVIDSDLSSASVTSTSVTASNLTVQTIANIASLNCTHFAASNLVLSSSVTASNIMVGTLTADRVVVSDSNKNLVSAAVSTTEVNYLTGATSNIQGQLQTKIQPGVAFAGTLLVASNGGIDASSNAGALYIGASNASAVYIGSSSNAQSIFIGSGTGATTISIGAAGDSISFGGGISSLNASNVTISSNLTATTINAPTSVTTQALTASNATIGTTLSAPTINAPTSMTTQTLTASNATIGSNISAATINAPTSITTQTLTASNATVSGTTTLNSNLTVASTAQFNSNANVAGALVVAGTTTLNSNLVVANITQLSSNLTVTGLTTLNSNTTVNGAYTVNLGTANSNVFINGASVNGTVLRIVSTDVNGRDWGLANNFIGGVGELSIYDYTAAAERLRVGSNGFVGIGQPAPVYPLDVAGSVSTTGLNVRYFERNINITTNVNLTRTISVRSDRSIWISGGGAFLASSDERIKTNIQDLDDEECLQQLRNIRNVKYEYIDKDARGASTVYGFLAQQIETVIPYAVSYETEVVPNIFTIGTVTHDSDHTYIDVGKVVDVVAGEKVRFIEDVTGVSHMLTIEAVSVSSSGSSTGASTVLQIAKKESLGTQAFVYGKLVSDFHTVDKQAIFTVAVGAVQELDRKVQTLEAALAQLQAQVAGLLSA
jgi:hypothetical protein